MTKPNRYPKTETTHSTIDENYVKLAGIICRMFFREYQTAAKRAISEKLHTKDNLTYGEVMELLKTDRKCRMMKKEADDVYISALSMSNMISILESTDMKYASCFDKE